MKFEELLEELGIDHRRTGHEHCRPGWIQLDCPFCSKDWKHFRLGYNIAKRYTHCWLCGFKRTPNVLAEITGESIYKYILLFKDIESVQFEKEKTKGTLRLPTSIIPFKEPHREYLLGRNYDPDELHKKWGVMGTDYDSDFPWRIYIPIVYRGEVVSWTTRRIVDHPVRYWGASKSHERIPRKELLYGQDYVRGHSIIVVEGCFDVWRIGEGAVATMTTSYSRAQLLKIAKYPKVTICFDNTPDAQEKASMMMNDLKVFGGEYNRVILEAKDPSLSSPEEIQELRRRFLE